MTVAERTAAISRAIDMLRAALLAGPEDTQDGNEMNRDVIIDVMGGLIEIDGGPDWRTTDYDCSAHKPLHVIVQFDDCQMM